MYKRNLEAELKELSTQYPVVTLLGPRQSGKTTLVQATFPEKPYENLEDPDPRGFLDRHPEGAIFDEIQRVPALLSYIQTRVDQAEKKGMYILTGSHQLLTRWSKLRQRAPARQSQIEAKRSEGGGHSNTMADDGGSIWQSRSKLFVSILTSGLISLHEAVAQSLAGRTALLTLLPMSLEEVSLAGFDLSLDQLMLRGGYPRIFKDGLDPTKAYRNYFQTYVERDLRQLIHVKDLSQFERFIRICAGRIGQILNLEEIGGEVGISSHTVKEWISMLEASFIVTRLQPYFENFGKRLIKSPKIYFTDVGLAVYLLGIENEQQLSRDPLRGHLVENFVLLELIKSRLNRGLDPQLYYYRDVQKNKVDVIFKRGNDLVPIEIKASKTFHREFLKRVQFFQDLVGDRAPIGYVIYAGDQEQKIHSIELINYKRASSIL